MLQYFWRSISILPHLKHPVSSSEWGVEPYNRAFVWAHELESNLLKDKAFVTIMSIFCGNSFIREKEHFQRIRDYQGSRMGLFMGKIAFWEECGVYSVVD